MKNNNKNGLDEMQKERRNHIGNQMFLMMFYALLLNSGIYGFYSQWLRYPVSVMIIITLCMIVYLVRIILANAYLPPCATHRKILAPVLLSVLFSVVLVISAPRIFGDPPPLPADDGDGNSALILFIISAVGLVVAAVVALIQRASANADGTDE